MTTRIGGERPARAGAAADEARAMSRIASIGECMLELRRRSPSRLSAAGFGGDTLYRDLSGAVGVPVDYVTALATTL